MPREESSSVAPHAVEMKSRRELVSKIHETKADEELLLWETLQFWIVIIVKSKQCQPDAVVLTMIHASTSLHLHDI